MAAQVSLYFNNRKNTHSRAPTPQPLLHPLFLAKCVGMRTCLTKIAMTADHCGRQSVGTSWGVSMQHQVPADAYPICCERLGSRARAWRPHVLAPHGALTCSTASAWPRSRPTPPGAPGPRRVRSTGHERRGGWRLHRASPLCPSPASCLPGQEQRA